jgi:Transglycosylase SLT domain
MTPPSPSHGFHARSRLALARALALAGALALGLLAVSAVAAWGESTETPAEAPAGVHGQVSEPAASTEGAPAAGGREGAAGTPKTAPTTAAPEVKAQSPQAASVPSPPRRNGAGHRRNGSNAKEAPSTAPNPVKPSTQPAPPPSSLTPPGRVGFESLGAPISGVPDFFIESFRIPPFLLPIYQAAGTAYDIPWQVLAAINEVETDYGRDLSISSAGAEGWMQFLPSSWARYGVDATGAGYEDPYNPADAIFAAARYLQAAGGGTATGGGGQHIRAAIYAYNHSQEYVESVMLRAQLLGGTPPELLSAITGLTESRFPVHAPARFSDGFPAAPAEPARTLAGTMIYTQAGAPVIAVQDGQITAVGDSPTLGHYVRLRDAYGNTYTYAQLGSVAALYPVLEPRVHTAVSPRIGRPGAASSPRTSPPSTPASAGVQPHSPLSQAAVSSSLAMGAASGLETPPVPVASAPPPALPAPPAPTATPRVFRAGPDEVYLHSLVPGVQVLAGTVLGHVGAGSEQESTPTQAPPASVAGQPVTAGETAEPHMLFQIRPAGAGAPLIDPKPILDGWVRLEETSIFRAKGENPFLATSPTVGQVLLESKPQLEQQVLRDPGVHLARCERGEIRASQVDRRVLATLEFLSVSGLSPTVAPASCGHGASAGMGRGPNARNIAGGAAGDVVDISAIDGTPLAGHEGPGSVADIAVRRLLRLQGTMKPAQIVSANSYPGAENTLTLPGYHGLIHVVFASSLAASSGPGARAARTVGSPLTPSQWIQLVARLGEIPEPAVAGKPSAAAILDPSTHPPAGAGSSTGASAGSGTAGGAAESAPVAPSTPGASTAPSSGAGGG